MKLLLDNHRAKLLANHHATLAAEGESLDHNPVVKFFNPCGAGTWLISEMDEDEIMFGLCDPGQGTPELGYQSFDEIESYRGPFCLGIERDMHWEASKTLTEYANESRKLGRIAA